MKNSLFCIFLLFIMCLWRAEAQPQPLSSEQAFSFSAYMTQPDQLVLQWKIAPGYYLYQDKLRLYNHQKQIALKSLPEAITKQEGLHKTYQVYEGVLNIIVPLNTASPERALFTVEYQGCSLQNFCYSPVKKDFQFNPALPAIAQFVTSAHPISYTEVDSKQISAEKLFNRHGLFLTLLGFLGLGLLLAFTPCVLPMVPILYGIIIGHRKKNPSTVKAFSLSLAYVLGMAITYAIAGMVVAVIGRHIQTTLQTPWIIILFSAIFVLLALSLFGLYEFQLPARWQKHLAQLSNRQKKRNLFGGVFNGLYF